MTAMGIPANAKQLAALVNEGEGPALEFKRSTGELKEGMQTRRMPQVKYERLLLERGNANGRWQILPAE